MNAPANRGRRAGAGMHGRQLSLLPEAVFSPLWPKPSTLGAEALTLLLDGHALTHPRFEEMTGSWRLAAYVRDLRDAGWPIDSVEVHQPQNPSRPMAIYTIAPPVIQAAREMRP